MVSVKLIALSAVAALATCVTAAPASDSAPTRYIVMGDTSSSDAPLQRRGAGGNKLKHLKMTIATLTDAEVAAYKKAGIAVYKDAVVKTSAVQTNPPNWGLDRIDQHSLPLDNAYTYCSDGSDVDAYIIDTGILANHQEFTGRAVFEKNFVNDGINTDCNGHGTHVASTVGGSTVGVAKGVKLHGLKVLGCGGSGLFSDVIAAIDYVVGQHNSGVSKKTVINMSLAGGKYDPVNAAVKAATDAGVIVIVAAANDAANACNYSPASAPSAITVAASDINDNFAGFSNFGSCVDIIAPGVDIYGAFIPNPNSYASLSGTSMASPHVAGISALLLSSGAATTPAQVAAKLTAQATSGVVKSVPAGTPNLLVYEDHSTCGTTNCVYTIPTFDGISKYCVIAATDRNAAAASCVGMGGNLAAIQSTAEFGYLASRVQQKSWVRSWQGNDYGGACLLFYPGGAIVGASSCSEQDQGICEIPV